MSEKLEDITKQEIIELLEKVNDTFTQLQEDIDETEEYYMNEYTTETWDEVKEYIEKLKSNN